MTANIELWAKQY